MEDKLYTPAQLARRNGLWDQVPADRRSEIYCLDGVDGNLYLVNRSNSHAIKVDRNGNACISSDLPEEVSPQPSQLKPPAIPVSSFKIGGETYRLKDGDYSNFSEVLICSYKVENHQIFYWDSSRSDWIKMGDRARGANRGKNKSHVVQEIYRSLLDDRPRYTYKPLEKPSSVTEEKLS